MIQVQNLCYIVLIKAQKQSLKLSNNIFYISTT